MADYHPLIARAVAGLEKNTGENRRALYERARTALVAQLRGVQPALEESEITRERLALEEAIRKIEAESARQAREAPRPPPPPPLKRADPPKRPDQPPPSRREEPLKRDEPKRDEPRRETRVSPPREQTAPPPAAAQPRQTSRAPGRERPPRDPNLSLSDQAMRGFRDVVSDPNAAAEVAKSERPAFTPTFSPPPPPARHDPVERHDDNQPELRNETPQKPPQDDLWETPLATRQPVDFDEQRPSSGRPRPPRKREPEEAAERPRTPGRYNGLIRIAIVAAVVGVVVGLGWWQRDTIGNAASGIMALVRGNGTPAPRETPATQARPKITDRIGQPGSAPQGVPAVAQRVVLYEEDPDDPQGKRLVGTAVWRTEMQPPAPGRPAEMVVRADVDIPERKMTMTWSLRRNADPALPASHTIEILFNLPPDAPSGGVQNVPGVLMKQAEQTRGVPLAGLAVKVTPGFFLIGLSSLEADMQRNIQLLKERSWFDVPIVYNNNRRAILAMEKGTPGERAFNEAFAAWQQ